MKLCIRVVLEKLPRKFKFHQYLTVIRGTLHEDHCTFFIVSRSVLHRMRNVSDKVAEEIKTHILYSIIFFYRKSYICEIMLKNFV